MILLVANKKKIYTTLEISIAVFFSHLLNEIKMMLSCISLGKSIASKNWLFPLHFLAYLMCHRGLVKASVFPVYSLSRALSLKADCSVARSLSLEALLGSEALLSFHQVFWPNLKI